jgi:DNA-directed RNA polymerase specialized sigma24 family protein
LDIDRVELSKRFKEKDWNYVFSEAYRISGFLLSNKYKIFDSEEADDMKQECVLNLLKKIEDEKVDPDRNLFSFIWQNSNYRILEILRKERNRKNIASFVSFDLADFELNKKDEVVYRYEE